MYLTSPISRHPTPFSLNPAFIQAQLTEAAPSSLDTFALQSFCTEHSSRTLFFPFCASPTSTHPSGLSLGVTSSGKPFPAQLCSVLFHTLCISLALLWVSQWWDWVTFTPSLPMPSTVPDPSWLNGWVTKVILSNILCQIS